MLTDREGRTLPRRLGWIVALSLLLTTACMNPDDDSEFQQNGNDHQSGSGEIFGTSEDNADTVAGALDMIGDMLNQNQEAATIRQELVRTLQDDPQVAGADVDPAHDTVWVDFINGETQVFMIVDAEADDGGDVATLDDETAGRVPGSHPAESRSGVEGSTGGPRAAEQFNLNEPHYRLPGNNKALLRNGLTPFHANWDMSRTDDRVADMLEPRGYQVEHGLLTLDDFNHLTDYSVIVLETHGTWRDPQYPSELLKLPKEISDQLNIPESTCGGAGTRFALLTTTPATAESVLKNAGDLACGRLVLWNVSLRQADGTVTHTQNYGVTPNYVREHDQKKFPNNTLLILNSCRGYQQDLSSPFKNMLFDKCERGAYFLGWTDRVYSARAFRALLYLFQFMTAANEEVTAGPDNTKVVEKATPPRGSVFTGLNAAWNELDAKLYTTDLGSGAQLFRSVQNDELFELILAPHPLSLEFAEGGSRGVLGLFSDSNPTVTIGGASASVTPDSLCCSTIWRVTAPASAYGDIVVSQDGRNSMPRTLHRWRPQISIKGSFDGFDSGTVQYTITLVLQARATIDLESMRIESIWDAAPSASFTTVWDPAASTVGWQISGETTSGSITSRYEGSGLQNLGPEDGGRFEVERSGNGVSVSLDVYAPITYTVVTTDTSNNSTTTAQYTDTISVFRDNIPLSTNLTVDQASYKDDVGLFGQADLSWNAFGPQPPFDPNAEPR